MKTFKHYLDAISVTKHVPTDSLEVQQGYPDGVDKDWVEYLRGHLRSGQSERAFRRKNPTYGGNKAVTKKVWWKPLEIAKNPGRPGSFRIMDGHHRYYARQLEGQKQVKVYKP